MLNCTSTTTNTFLGIAICTVKHHVLEGGVGNILAMRSSSRTRSRRSPRSAQLIVICLISSSIHCMITFRVMNYMKVWLQCQQTWQNELGLCLLEHRAPHVWGRSPLLELADIPVVDPVFPSQIHTRLCEYIHLNGLLLHLPNNMQITKIHHVRRRRPKILLSLLEGWWHRGGWPVHLKPAGSKFDLHVSIVYKHNIRG